MLAFKIKGFCHICHKALRFRIYECDEYFFCKKHFHVYSENEWISFKSYLFHSEDENAAHLEDLSIKIYQEKRLPILQKMNYYEKDFQVITETQLFCLKNHKEILLQIFKKKGPSEDGPSY